MGVGDSATGNEDDMICTGYEDLFTDITNQSFMEHGITLFESEDNTFEFKSFGKKFYKINRKTGEAWIFSSITDTWDYIKTERPEKRDPYFAKR